ncbi:hypothetical protein LSH36_273g03094 [Paralvinella palmiformis]|uniref:Adenosine kinase n=1 Tax=Paralvinella palmiformis TaxID=53620 RepID=A0AAD9JKQ6_9ANNE|nr:hypothetical protein LSH36_273g03094 [Paralvinella palmiformis]
MRWTQVLCSKYFKRYIERELHKSKARRQWHPLSGWKELKKERFYPNEHRPWTAEYKAMNPFHQRTPKTLFVEPIKKWDVYTGDRIGSKRQYRGVSLIDGWTSCHHYSTSAGRKTVKRGILLGIGNPLLDITIQTDEAFLSKYDLKPNDAIVADVKQMPMFDDMMKHFKPLYGAGGAAQNTIRVAQWLLGVKHATTFFGGIGKDERGEILAQKARESGVDIHYQITDKFPTGVCGAVITDDNRSLVACLGAADYFEHTYMESSENWALVERADFFYIGGFMFPVCNQVIFDIAEHVCKMNKTLVMNLSAPFLCQYFADRHLDIMPYIDILFGNRVEAAQFCALRGIEAENIEEMALQVSQLPKANPKRERVVIFTGGQKPTIAVVRGQVTTHPIRPVQREEICDTNGCGDAFVGGFLAELVEVLVGPDKGRQGIINCIVKERNWVFVEGLNNVCILDAGYFSYLSQSQIKQATAVEWRYTETGEEVRVSLQTGRIIPLPEGAKMEDDLVIPDQYVEGDKDTKERDLKKVTFEAKLCTFEEDIMDELNIVENRKPAKTYWY